MALLEKDLLALKSLNGEKVVGTAALLSTTSRNADGVRLVDSVVLQFDNGTQLTIGDSGEVYWSLHTEKEAKVRHIKRGDTVRAHFERGLKQYKQYNFYNPLIARVVRLVPARNPEYGQYEYILDEDVHVYWYGDEVKLEEEA